MRKKFFRWLPVVVILATQAAFCWFLLLSLPSIAQPEVAKQEVLDAIGRGASDRAKAGELSAAYLVLLNACGISERLLQLALLFSGLMSVLACVGFGLWLNRRTVNDGSSFTAS